MRMPAGGRGPGSSSKRARSIARGCARSSADTGSPRRFPTMSERPIEMDAKRAFEAKARWHREQAQLPLREKVRILIELQRQDLPLVARQRALKPWEQPWPIEP